jgi:hypothetical protein
MSHRSGSLVGFALRFVLSTFLSAATILILGAPAKADSVALAELGQLDMFFVDCQFADRGVAEFELQLLWKSDCYRWIVVSASLVGRRPG